jgi:hypothetical protein
VWWVAPLIGLVELAVAIGLGRALQPTHLEFYAGMGVGIAITITMVFWDSPPHHIDRWRLGAEGEKATAKALRRLIRDGWTVVHDVDVGRGNLDHILVGPAGVFVLETKNLRGMLAVHGGVLSVRWREDPSDGYNNAELSRRVRARAAALSSCLRDVGLPGVWVQPLVVLWGHFDQRSIESQGVAWVRGHDLASMLSKRPAVLEPPRATRTTQALEEWLASDDQRRRQATPRAAAA